MMKSRFDMTVPSVHCEAKLHGFRRTADGVVVSFVLHPAEVPSALALDPLGTRYMLALAAIGDDEQAIEQPSPSTTPAAERPGVETGISPTARARASERYANLPPMKQASEDAGMLAKDERFQVWACEQKYGAGEPYPMILDETASAQFIRDYCCEGDSRKLIATDPEAYRKFLALQTMFKIAVGEIAEPR